MSVSLTSSDVSGVRRGSEKGSEKKRKVELHYTLAACTGTQWARDVGGLDCFFFFFASLQFVNDVYVYALMKMMDGHDDMCIMNGIRIYLLFNSVYT